MKLSELTVDGRGCYGIGASAVEKSDELYTYLRITDIYDDGTLNKAGLKSVDDPDAEKYLLKPNDIVFARTGNSVGKSYFYDERDGVFVYAGFLIKFSLDPAKVNPRFVKYYCQSQRYKNWVASFSTGSTRGNINAQTYGDMEILTPSRAQQDFLVEILSALDDKIELNRRVNGKLAALLETGYRGRFGGDKVKARRASLADVCRYSTERVAVEELTLDRYYSTENMAPEKAGAFAAATLPAVANVVKCRAGDVLVSNIRPYFKKILYCQTDCGCSPDVLCFTPQAPELSAFLFATLYADEFFDFMVAGSKGTKMPRGDKKQITTYPIALPTVDELNEFNEFATPILTEIENNRLENNALAAVRDTLTPRLISGEIDVSDVSL